MKSSSTRRDDRIAIRLLEGIRRRCPGHVATLEALGDLYTGAGQVEEGLEIDLHLTSRFPDNDVYWYNLACSHALMKNVSEALKAIAISVKLGYSDDVWMCNDPDLELIRDHPEFLRLSDAAKENRSSRKEG